MAVDIDIIVQRQQQTLAAEFFGAQFENSTFAYNLYNDDTTLAAADRYLEKARQWVKPKGRRKEGYWKALPKRPANENELYKPYGAIFADILQGHDQSDTARTRTIQDTHNIRLMHREPKGYMLGSKPGFIVEATGPSFQVPYGNPDGLQVNHNFGFTNAITAIEIKTDSAAGTGESLMPQVAVYAR